VEEGKEKEGRAALDVIIIHEGGKRLDGAGPRKEKGSRWGLAGPGGKISSFRRQEKTKGLSTGDLPYPLPVLISEAGEEKDEGGDFLSLQA